LDDTVKFRLLILGKGLGGEKVEGPGFLVGEEGVKHRQVITEGLSRGRRGYHHHVPAPADLLPDLPLVGIQGVDAPAPQGGGESGVEVRGKRDGLAGGGGKDPLFHDKRGKRRVPKDFFQYKKIAHIRLEYQEERTKVKYRHIGKNHVY
jgi:hypothetical protein